MKRRNSETIWKERKKEKKETERSKTLQITSGTEQTHKQSKLLFCPFKFCYQTITQKKFGNTDTK